MSMVTDWMFGALFKRAMLLDWPKWEEQQKPQPSKAETVALGGRRAEATKEAAAIGGLFYGISTRVVGHWPVDPLAFTRLLFGTHPKAAMLAPCSPSGPPRVGLLDCGRFAWVAQGNGGWPTAAMAECQRLRSGQIHAIPSGLIRGMAQ